ncbi:MAG: DNA replication protein DnaC, partial [Oscillospiraceae bacterium]|nr:DNA replication protein DnaC [Oscillospiraceae bacterium]
MKTTSRCLLQAEQELDRRRQRAEAQARHNRDIAYQKVPALETLEREIAQAGVAVIEVIGKGGGAQEFVRLLREQNLAAQEKRRQLLLENGFAADFLQPAYTCKKCGDSGFVGGMRCDCFMDLLRQLAYKELCMNAPVEVSTFARFSLEYYSVPDQKKRMQDILLFCQDYVRGFSVRSKNLLFFGATGLGKTHLSLAIAKEL